MTTGNVGQLALDVLITTFSVGKVGSLDSPFVVPMIGNDAIGTSLNGSLVTSLEGSLHHLLAYLSVFHSPSNQVVLLQQRAPVIKGKQRKFVEDLLAWFKACQFKSIVLLSSVDKITRMDDTLLVG